MTETSKARDFWQFMRRSELAYFRFKEYGSYVHAAWGVHLEGKLLSYENRGKRGTVYGGVTHFTATALTFEDLVDKLVFRENVARAGNTGEDEREG